MDFLNRRDFLQDSAGVAASLASMSLLGDAETAAATQPRVNANERLNVAVIGVKGRGQEHVRSLAGRHNCVVTHICDADSSVVGQPMTAAEKAQGMRPTYVQDLRRIMDNKNIHAGQHRHAEPLARPGRHLGHAGGQARLRRKAGQP